MQQKSGRGRRGLRGAIIALTLLGVIAAACGDDDDASGGSASDEQVVKIGVIAPIDGGLTSFGKGIENSVQLAVDEANDADAIPGFTIEVAAEDDSSDAETGKAAAATLAADNAVIGVVGTYNSAVAAEVAPVLEDAGIAMISPGNTDPALTVGSDATTPERQFDNYFRVVANDSQQGVVLADYATGDLGLTTAAVVNEEKPVSQGLADAFTAAFTAAGGEVVSTHVVPDGTTDFTDVAGEIAPLDPQLLFFGGEYEVAAAFRNAAAEINAPLMGGDGIKDDAYLTDTGAAGEGDYASSIGAPLESLASAADYAAAYEEAAFDDPPSAFGPYAYDAANLLIAAAASALEGLDDVTPEARAAVVDEVQAADSEGVTGRLAFDEYGDTVTKVFTIYQVEGTEWVPVTTVTVP